MNEFKHQALNLQQPKKVIFTALSKKNFYNRMLICKHAFDQGVVPVNPFTSYGYFLYELVDRDLVRNANNNLIQRCDELWVYGDIADGVLAEIKMFKDIGKPIRYFNIDNLPESVEEIQEKDLRYEPNVSHRL